MLQTNNPSESPAVPAFVKTGAELIGNDITDIPKLIDPIFPKVGVIALAGSSDTGKSSILRQMAMEIVSRKETFLGFPILADHHSVLYVSTEDDYYAMSSLIKKQNVDRKAPEEFNGLRFIFDTTDLQSKLEEELTRQPVDVIFIDAFSDLFSGDMNRVNDVRGFIHYYSLLAERFKCLIIFLHHTSKRTEVNEPSKHNMIGSQGFEAKMRVVIELRKDYQNPSSSIRHFCIVKGNYLGEEYKSRSFALNFTSDLVFEYTGRRVPFENLAPRDGRRNRNTAARDRAIELHAEGLSVTEIHEQLEGEGINISRSSVGNYVQGLNNDS